MYTCFVSAPAGVNLSHIKNLLSERNLKFVHPSDIRSHGQSISEQINKSIAESDIFIAVFDESLENGNTLFELGLAVGLRKQIVILAPPRYPLPSNLSGFLILKVLPDNFDALGFSLDQLLTATRKERGKKTQKSYKSVRATASPVSNKILEFKLRLQSTAKRIAGRELVNFVAELLKESGISIIQESKIPDARVDFAIWSDDLEGILGNPILIETKKSIGSRSQAERVTNQLLGYMEKSNSKSAIVLYLEGLPSTKVQRFFHHFNILFFQLEDLVEQLERHNFADAVRARRNLIAHGRDL